VETALSWEQSERALLTAYERALRTDVARSALAAEEPAR